MVRQRADAMDLRIGDEAESFLVLPLTPDRESCCAVEALGDLPGLGIRLRTRALTTTMYARFLIGDLFVHGIGGAKYDELGLMQFAALPSDGEIDWAQLAKPLPGYDAEGHKAPAVSGFFASANGTADKSASGAE